MGMLGRNRGPSFYEMERKRLQELLLTLKPGTDEYDKTMKEMMTLQEFAGKDKEMRSRLTKEGRSTIVGKIVGFLGIGGLIFGLTKFEKVDGSMFSGSNGEAKTGLLKAAFKLFG